MNIPLFSKTLLFSALVVSQSFVNAADVRLNGFASFAGGKVLKDTDNRFLADSSNATELGLLNKDAYYDDTVSFLPDSTYGLKIFADLEERLTATAQIVGRGANNFETTIDWAFLSYQLGNNFSVQVGRQRIPIFNYSSFLDVGYAYHWLRLPVTVYGGLLGSYQGASLSHKGSISDWEIQSQIYGGNTKNEQSQFGSIGADNLAGFSFKVSNEFLQVRFSTLFSDVFTDSPLSTTNEANPVNIFFTDLAFTLSLGDGFLGLEGTVSQATNSGEFYDVVTLQFDEQTTFLATAGYRFGDVTPHVTYSESSVQLVGDVNPFFEGLETGLEAVTVGVRWDFHPSAAFKIDYTLNSDGSDQAFINAAGELNDVDAISFGVDFVF